MTLRILPSGAFPVGLPQQGGTVALEMDSSDFATSPQLGKFTGKLKVPSCLTASGFADSEGDSDAMPAQSCGAAPAAACADLRNGVVQLGIPVPGTCLPNCT